MEKAKTIVAGNRVHRALFDESVTEEDWKKAETELNETSQIRTVALGLLKELIAEQTDFIARTDDSYLLQFLRARKFDVERAFKLLSEHYEFRAKNPKFFPSPSNIEKALKSNMYNYLPHRDHKGRAIYVGKMCNWNPDEVSYADFVATGYLMSEYVLNNPVTQINGFVAVWDFKGFSLKQFVHFCSPKNISLLTTLIQDRFPGRFKVAYCINCSYLMQTAWNLFKGVLKEKFRKRVKMISNIKALHQYVDSSILPEEFGGVMPSSDCKELANIILKHEQYINYNRKFGYNPSDFY